MTKPSGSSTTDKHARITEQGDQHQASSADTPLLPQAFERSEEEKMAIIAKAFGTIMETLGLDLRDDSLQGTPARVAKMYVQEIFRGLDPANFPEISVFDNKYDYRRMLVERNIAVKSTCEHHFQPILGKAHIGYIANGKVIGLSKLNRIVDYFARRPQVQERMTKQILLTLQQALGTQDVIVLVDAKHMCVTHRGIEDQDSSTLTIEYSGQFSQTDLREEFLRYIQLGIS